MSEPTIASFSFLNRFAANSIWIKRIILVAFGALYPLGFSPIDYWPLTLISLVLLINELVAHSQQTKETPSKVESLSFFSIVFYWGIGMFGVGTSWVYVSIHEFGHAPVLGALAISLLFVVVLALEKTLVFYLAERFLARRVNNQLILIIPFAWVVSELLQRYFLSGFPWLFAGYSQIDGPLWMLSTWLGVYGVSWFMLAISVCLVILARGFLKERIASKRLTVQSDRSKKSSSLPAEALILGILLSVPLLAYSTLSKPIDPAVGSLDVALVQPNIGQDRKWDRGYFSQVIDVLYQQSEAHWDADLLVWPEGAIPAYQHQVTDILSDLDQRSRQHKIDLLLGLPVYDREQQLSFSALLALGDHPQSYHKQVLVPFGEYVPMADLLRGIIEFLDLPMSSFSTATRGQQAMTFANYQVVPAICYEIAYPDIVSQLVIDADSRSDKPMLLVTVSNDAWFGDSFGPYQHMQMARMRALELGIPLVRSTNDGITAMVDARGNQIAELPRFTQGTLRQKISLEYYPTLYRKYGLLGIYLILSLSLVLFLLSGMRDRYKSTDN